ncbi:hypothetical protein scyTo_0026001 [Scyliorhinus torazame]|uniref:Uncharacterized protein n=1 Tax=Scyliorhinus torazame TaxID=75743 RepID=A0A401QIU0_SCYTO|nr:hypothetical protein [Scyliorhinus torazame]
MSLRFEDQLEADIEDMLESYLKFNRSKNVFSFVRTPATMLTLMISMHIASGFLSLLGLGFLTFILSFANGICSLTLITWCYVKYTGQSPLLGEIIDAISDSILSGVTSLIVSRYLNPEQVTMVAGLAHASRRN